MYIYRGKISWSDKFQNEGITILFLTTPTPGAQARVLTQWSTIPDEKDDKTFAEAVVVPDLDDLDESPSSPSSFMFSFGPVTLYATIDADESLVLAVNDGTVSMHSSTTSMTLRLIYKSDTPFSNHRIYTGKLSWRDVEETYKAVDESIFVIAPCDVGDDTPIITLWQWTELEGSGEKVNVEYFSSLDIINSGHQNTALKHPSHDVTLSFTKDEKSALETLSVEKYSPFGAIQRSHAHVQLSPLRNTNTVKNDTGMHIFCTLRETGTGTVDNVLAWGGMCLAILGMGTAIAAAAGVAVAAHAATGVVLALLGLVPAGPGWYYVVMRPSRLNDPVKALLLKDETITRTAASGNDLEVVRSRVVTESGLGFLTIAFGRLQDLEDGEISISHLETNPPEDPKLKYTEVLRFLLPSPNSTLTAGGLLSLPSLRPRTDGEPITNALDSNGVVYSGATESGAPIAKFHEALETLIIERDYTFRYDPAMSSLLTFTTLTYTKYKIQRLPTSRLWVLKLYDHTIKCSDDDRRRVSITGNSVKKAIERDGSKLAYHANFPKPPDGTPPKLYSVKEDAVTWQIFPSPAGSGQSRRHVVWIVCSPLSTVYQAIST